MTDGSADLIKNWNEVAAPRPPGPVQVHDETLRDGLQAASVIQPTVEQRLELLHLMDRIGVDSVCLGMPISHATASRTVQRLAEEIVSERLGLSAACAARTVRADIMAVVEVAQAAGLEMWVMAFVGISPIRMYAERWEHAAVVREVAKLVGLARAEGLRVCIITEDTTRSPRDHALAVYLAALEAGAERICICDTVGYATPWGAAALVDEIRRGLDERGFTDAGIDWHGHNDRGLAIANSLAASAAGADRLHGAGLGIGERSGNASIEQLLVNLHDIGWRTAELTELRWYCDAVSRSCGVGIPPNQPFVGADAYRTVAGVHAAAIRKARAMGDDWLAERVYAGVPASLLGREQRIDVGPGSGRANILHWLDRQGLVADPALVAHIEVAVAGAQQVLTDEQLLAMVADVSARYRPGSTVGAAPTTSRS
jgi:isopropylmalate/homocitrate/citramalate synthase